MIAEVVGPLVAVVVSTVVRGGGRRQPTTVTDLPPDPSTPPRWPRPVPLVGDSTSAAQRSADPAGWSFDQPTIEALHAVVAARRDVRRFRPDPVPAGVLRRVLEAGHQAPSVGHSQPWRFIVVTEQATIDRAARFADQERLRQADLLAPDRRARLLDLQLDGIREAPVGIVVACDRRAPAAGVLGRASFADADMWSCACAVQNMWLAARAAGLGLGWVTLFQPADLAELLHLPGGVETLGWLCLGWPDERPPEPGLQRHGWSRRLPLDDVIVAERWPEAGEPARPRSHLAGSHLAGPDRNAVVAARDTGDDLLAVPGSLGVLDATANRVLALDPTPPDGGTLLLAAADHPVTRYGISPYPPSVTADVLAAARRGVSMGAATARQAGLRVEAVRAEPAGAGGDLVETDALTRADVDVLLEQGRDTGRRLAADGLVCLGEVGIGNTTVAAALSCALVGLEPGEAVGLGAGADSAMVARKRDVVTRAVARARAVHGDALDEPRTALAALGGPEFALLAGVVLGAADRRVPVVLDGLVTSLAALAVVRLEPAAQTVLVAGQRSRERAHSAVLAALGLEPLLDLRLRSGEGVGACLAAQLLLTALRARRSAAHVDSGPTDSA
jgi:nicotinate-nucleotide--dimethylbenzimidazole phosphoribosyltransferase